MSRQNSSLHIAVVLFTIYSKCNSLIEVMFGWKMRFWCGPNKNSTNTWLISKYKHLHSLKRASNVYCLLHFSIHLILVVLIFCDNFFLLLWRVDLMYFNLLQSGIWRVERFSWCPKFEVDDTKLYLWLWLGNKSLP